MLNILFRGGWILLALLTLLILLARVVGGGMETGDLLVYSLVEYDERSSLMIFDPHRRLSAPIHRVTEPLSVYLLSDDRLVLSTLQEINRDIFITENILQMAPLVNITRTPQRDEYSLAWSPDGRSLVFISYDGMGQQVHLWNGETTINITPYDLGSHSVYQADWSSDGRLAFTAHLGGNVSRKMYLWDGNSTIRVNESLTASNFNPRWSSDGQLAFVSVQNGDYDLLVWDGVSFENGVPNVDTFINVAPERNVFESAPYWTEDGLLAFYTGNQVYGWDGQTIINGNERPTLWQTVRRRSPQGLQILSGYNPQGFQIQDTNNLTIVDITGTSPRWSSEGYLAFCRPGGNGWRLTLWDGREFITIAEGSFIQAQWQSGARMLCYSG